MLKIENLTKRYGQHTVVDDLSFRCAAGEVLGFLGPNGAGKSTTMKMVTGFVPPSAGRVSVCGLDIDQASLEARRCIGYLPEGAPCYPEMTPSSFLEFIADIRGLTPAERKTRLDSVIEALHLGPVLDQSIDTLSKGFKRRVGLAQAILHDPKVLILDEPTDGLDPNQKHEVRELIRSMATNKLIVLSTHILEEVEAVCTRAIIIANGSILADDTPEQLARRSRSHNAVRLCIGANESFDQVQAALVQLVSVDSVEVDRGSRTITALARTEARDGETWQEVFDLISRQNWDITGLQLEVGQLDQVFREITGGSHA
jgi:ABC-2 type transport system ATP-binding protein